MSDTVNNDELLCDLIVERLQLEFHHKSNAADAITSPTSAMSAHTDDDSRMRASIKREKEINE